MEVYMKKSSHDGVYSFWSVSIVLSMLIALFVLGFASCAKAPGAAAESASPSPSQSETPPDTGTPPSTSPENPTAPVTSPSASGSGTSLAETEDMGQEYVDKFVFLGDSTTYGLGYYDIVDDSQVWTPASGTLTLSLWNTATIVYPEDGSEISIKDAVAKKQPEYMLITLGVNGVSFMDEQYFTSEYTKLVQAIKEASPNTKILLNSIYPVTASYSAGGDGITNEKIDAANSWISSIASSTSVKFLDSESVIKDENGAMPEKLCNDGKLHFNADGYNLVISYLRTHGYQ